MTTKERLSNEMKPEGLVEDEDAALGHSGIFRPSSLSRCQEVKL